MGANDGCINDPIYELVKKNKNKTKIILIEPQTNIIKFLKKSYEFHSNAYIANYAVGPDERLKLYRVKPEYYDSFEKLYLKDSPSYRVPSGFSSFDRNHVLKHLKGNLPSSIQAEEAIECIEVPSSNLLSILANSPWSDNEVDILQIDAEGMDDKVIYASDIKKTRPKIINFERNHLSGKAYDNLCSYLLDNGYSIHDYTSFDSLALLNDYDFDVS